MKRQYLLSFLSGSAPAALGILTTPLLARELSVPERGLYGSLATLGTVLGIVFLLGQDETIISARAEGHSFSDIALWLKRPMVLATAGAAITMLLSTLFVYHQPLTLSLVLLVAVTSLLPLYNVSIGWWKSRQQVQAISLALLYPALLRTSLVVLGCLLLDLNFLSLLVLTFFANVPTAVKGLREIQNTQQDSEHTTSLKLGTSSFLAWSGALASFLLLKLDLLFGLQIVGAKQLGYYAVAAAVAEIPLIAARILMQLSFKDSVGQMHSWMKKSILAAITTAAFVVMTSKYWFVPIFGDKFEPSLDILPWLVLASLLRAIFEAAAVNFSRLASIKLGMFARLLSLAFILLLLSFMDIDTGVQLSQTVSLANAFSAIVAMIFFQRAFREFEKQS